MFAAFYFFGGDVYFDTGVMVTFVLFLVGPLIALMAANAIKTSDDSEYIVDYKSWRMSTLVMFYMTIMACVSFVLATQGAYDSSDRTMYDHTCTITSILYFIWLAFLAINTICFLLTARSHNNSSSVLTDDFQNNLAKVLAEIDEFNGIKVPKPEKAKRGKKKGGDEIVES